MGIYSGGTFRVGPTPRFSFVNTNVEYYDHSIDLWNRYKGIWSIVRSKFGNGRGGSLEGAKKIQIGLEYLNKYNPKKENEEFSQDEIELIKDILGRKKLSLLDFSNRLSASKRGRQFEDIMARVANTLTTKGEATGTQTVNSPLKIETEIDLTGTGITQKKGNINKLWELVNKQINKRSGETLQEMIGNATIELQKIVYEGNGSATGKIIARQVKVQGKVDISTLNAQKVELSSEISQPIQDLAEALAGHTFSLKNYTSKTMNNWGGISLGYANKFRAYSSFLYGALGNETNFADVCTFIFASEQSHNPTVHKYLNWARYIYELTGLGQEGKNGLVDYLIVNTSDVGVTNIKVYPTSDLLKNMPEGEPGAVLREIVSRNWRGQETSSTKFIFAT